MGVRRFSGFALMAVLVAPGTARADYKEAYKRGMEQVERGNWPAVAQRMRESLAEQGQEGEPIKLYGMRFETYLPHYYLGLAAFQTGDCATAIDAWRASEGQGAVKKTAQYKTLLANRKTCEARLAQTTPKPQAPATPDPAQHAVTAAEAEVNAADAASNAVAGLSGESDLVGLWPKEASLGPAQKQAADLLAEARNKLDAAKKKPDAAVANEARELASRAAKQFEVVRQAATAKRDELKRLADQKAAEDRRRAELMPLTPVGSASPSGPPPELLRGAKAYFNGQYAEAVQALSGVNLGGRAGLHALLIRAAARYALYASGGKKDDTLRRDATADIQACRRIDASFTPDAQAFSPRFIDLFKSTR